VKNAIEQSMRCAQHTDEYTRPEHEPGGAVTRSGPGGGQYPGCGRGPVATGVGRVPVPKRMNCVLCLVQQEYDPD